MINFFQIIKEGILSGIRKNFFNRIKRTSNVYLFFKLAFILFIGCISYSVQNKSDAMWVYNIMYIFISTLGFMGANIYYWFCRKLLSGEEKFYYLDKDKNIVCSFTNTKYELEENSLYLSDKSLMKYPECREQFYNKVLSLNEN